MRGKLIVIEGLDGSGKSTQLQLLREKLDGKNVRYVKFPNYESDACSLVNMYLHGEFGSDPSDVNPFAASTFYAVDRYASFKQDWGRFYNDGGVILCDRYTTSNAVHQAGKLDGELRDDFLDWLYDFEFGKMGIPAPDKVIYLDMPVEISQRLMSARYNGDEGKKDIHESNVDYLSHCREAALYAANHLSWTVINCAVDGRPRDREDIANEVYSAVREIL